MKIASRLNYLFVFIIFMLFLIQACSLKKQVSLNESAQVIDEIVIKVITECKMNFPVLKEEIYEIKKEGKSPYPSLTKTYLITDDTLNFKEFSERLDLKLKEIGAKINKSKFLYEKNSSFASFDIVFKKLKVYILNFEVASVRKKDKVKVAIVLDDWGYNMYNLSMINGLDIAFTLSILPNLPYSKRITKEAKAEGHEVILHLPMESHSSKALEEYVIKTGMKEEEIIKVFRKSLETVPGATGVSNHMGSKATEDKELMKTLFLEMKKDKLYFLDSLVTGKSCAEEIADEINLRFVRRSVFLDNESSPDYIKNQFQELISLAKLKGKAVAIGHDRKETLKVLLEILKDFKEDDIEFVHLSELVN